MSAQSAHGPPSPERPPSIPLGIVIRAAACMPLAFLAAGDVRTAEAAFTLALVTGGFAAASVLYATFREQVVVRRTVARLRDPDKRAETVQRLRRQVASAAQTGDLVRLEDSLRQALEPLLVVGLWDEVSELAEYASPHHRTLFSRWLAGVHALAELHRGDPDEAKRLLDQGQVHGPWLTAVDALRLALAREGEEALAKLGDGPKRPSYAIKHQRRVARVHALAALGRRDEARKLLRQMADDDVLEAALSPEGPATGMAASMLSPAGGPFRASG